MSKNFEFNLKPLLNDIQKQLNSGLTTVVSDFIKKYEMYEETHNHILNVPFVKQMQVGQKFNEILLENKYDMNANIISKQMENIYN
jgi:hypothetical protein